jgi:hypothetical protein
MARRRKNDTAAARGRAKGQRKKHTLANHVVAVPFTPSAQVRLMLFTAD